MRSSSRLFSYKLVVCTDNTYEFEVLEPTASAWAPPPACGREAAALGRATCHGERARSSRLGHRLAVASPSYCLAADGGGARCTAPLHSACPLPLPPPPTPAPPRTIFRIGREKSIVQRAPNNFGKTHGALASSPSRPERLAARPVRRSGAT
ncbi:unnamed protein product [Pieris macdunnoughi]|uniref:Uncharacterized protein n=1 Tax=Pieris macdunnoughi TaxID=345717 RepID=A0A821PTW4_9NEOP|nr:unnamed protein product [Pieris macdunnoughi]